MDDLQTAAEMALKAEHYASAFRMAAKLVRDGGLTPEQLAERFDSRVELESSFAKALREDPIDTLRAEGF